MSTRLGKRLLCEGVRGTWRVDPARLGQPFTGRAALLSPFDRVLHDRKRMADLFEFDYALGDVQAGCKSSLGILRFARSVRRPAGGEA